MSCWAWPSMLVSGVRNSWETMATKARWAADLAFSSAIAF